MCTTFKQVVDISIASTCTVKGNLGDILIVFEGSGVTD